VLALTSACATLADAGGGDEALPNAAAGPFRPLRSEELTGPHAAPYVLRSEEERPRDVAVVDRDGDPATLEVVAYVARSPARSRAEAPAPPAEIARVGARDGRSFGGAPATVLVATEGWEGGTIGSPSVVVVGGEHWLYYAAGGGIGLARGPAPASVADPAGALFERETAAPVLAPDPSGWERGAVPASPAVVRLSGGRFVMFYEVAVGAARAIGEAESEDGTVWRRRGGGPALAPGGAGYDDTGGVGAPAAVVSRSPLGRDVLWIYHSATDASGARRIAVAARDGVDGPLVRALAAVFDDRAATLPPDEPAVVRFAGLSLLYATRRAGSADAFDFPAVVSGVAPAHIALGAPSAP
jgi:hypothetical protein